MTAPRQVLPGTTYLITRRCLRRQLLLRPSAITSQIFGYVLAVAARRFEVRIHAFCVMSNHFHLVLTDPEGRLPAFEQYLDSLIARAVNASLGRWETFWAPSSYSAVALTSPQDVIDKIGYVLANPVIAGLVRRGRDWPGLWSAPERMGGDALVARRPEVFFRRDGSMPEAATLELTAPPGLESAAQARDLVEAVLAAREAQAAADLGSRSRSVMGAERVLAQRPNARPRDAEPRRGLKPRVGARDKWKRVEALARLAAFLRAYRAAWSALREGVRDVVFPPGTYWLRVMQRVRCAAPG